MKLGDMGAMLTQARQMQEEMQKVQKELELKTVEATAGGGMVKVVATGKQKIQSLTLDPEVLKMNDREMLQDLVLAGVNEALTKAQEMVSSEMKGKMAEKLGPLGSLMNMFQ